MVSVSVSKKFGIEKSIGFEKFWYRKKVSVSVLKKVSVSVSIFGGIVKYFLVINWFC